MSALPAMQLRVHSQRREHLPVDQTVGEHLVDLLVRASQRGPELPVVAAVVRRDRLDLVELQPVERARVPLHRLLAAMCFSQTDDGGRAEAVGLIGAFRRRARGGSAERRVAMVFLEWEDCRWWQWIAEISPTGAVLPETARVRSALDGDALPGGVGRWWSQARRSGERLTLAREPDPASSSGLVH